MYLWSDLSEEKHLHKEAKNLTVWLLNVPFELQIKSKFLQALLSDLLAAVHNFSTMKKR